MDYYFPYIGQGILLFILGYLVKLTQDNRTELRMINGRLTRVEERVTGNKELSDTRFKNLEEK